MFSLQNQTSAQAPTDLTQEPLVWKSWKCEHPEFNRDDETKTTFCGNKILILGGFKPDEDERTLDVILVDPEKQTFKIIPSVGDVESCSWAQMSACYWKDSKVVVSGGYDYAEDVPRSTVAVVTLKDLDSENPSAHWEKIVTPTELFRSYHSAHVHKDKMYIFGGNDEKQKKKYDVWCLDLTESTWSQCNFKDFSIKREGDSRYVFHENKAYAIPRWMLAITEIIREFDFETMTWKPCILPIGPAPDKIFYEPCPQVINGKIYFVESGNNRPKKSPPMRQILAFDLDSKSWTEIKTESFPNLDKIGRMFYCNNHLILNTIVENDVHISGEFWSLPLNSKNSL